MQFIHTADNHLRHSQYGREFRGGDFAAAFDQVVQAGLQRRVAAILVSGDLIDSTRPSPRIIRHLLDVHSRAKAANLPILVTSGNHDNTSPHWAEAIGSTPADRAHEGGIVIADNHLVRLFRDGGCLTVYGQPWVSREAFLDLKDSLPTADVLMFHGMIQELMPFKAVDALTLADLPTDKYQMVAAGDIHVRKYETVGRCVVGYPGSTELCEAGEAFDKTVTLVTKTPAGMVNEFLPIRTRKAMKFRLNTEDDVSTALAQVEAFKDSDPMVFGTFNPALTGIVARFCSKLNPERSILRLAPIGAIEQPLASTTEEVMQLADFLGKFIPAGTPLYETARTLLDPTANINDTLDAYLETALKAS